jgi:tetratricopeptide (TPR) repeat protein
MNMKLKTHTVFFVSLLFVIQGASYSTLAQERDYNKEWEVLHQQVMTLYTKGVYEQAIEEATKSLKFAQENIGEKHPSTASSLNVLAFIYHTIGNYQKAEPLYRRALKIRKDTLGPNHLDVARTQTNLALLNNHLKRFDEAELLYKRALTSVEKNLGLFHPDVAIILENLSLLYKDTNCRQLSKQLQERVLKIRSIQKKKNRTNY